MLGSTRSLAEERVSSIGVPRVAICLRGIGQKRGLSSFGAGCPGTLGCANKPSVLPYTVIHTHVSTDVAVPDNTAPPISKGVFMFCIFPGVFLRGWFQMTIWRRSFSFSTVTHFRKSKHAQIPSSRLQLFNSVLNNLCGSRKLHRMVFRGHTCCRPCFLQARNPGSADPRIPSLLPCRHVWPWYRQVTSPLPRDSCTNPLQHHRIFLLFLGP